MNGGEQVLLNLICKSYKCTGGLLCRSHSEKQIGSLAEIIRGCWRNCCCLLLYLFSESVWFLIEIIHSHVDFRSILTILKCWYMVWQRMRLVWLVTLAFKGSQCLTFKCCAESKSNQNPLFSFTLTACDDTCIFPSGSHMGASFSHTSQAWNVSWMSYAV